MNKVFFNVLPLAKARDLILAHSKPYQRIETVSTSQALARVTASSLFAPHPLPSFRRSTMDGYAVRAADTYGATSSLPALLRIVGEVAMGKSSPISLSRGEAAIIHTGGEVPHPADAVVQLENTQRAGESEIEVVKAVATGENIIQVGEDIAEGDALLPTGHWLRPQDIGGLLALGIIEIPVMCKPRVVIISSGDEIVSPDSDIKPGQVRDINSYTTAALALQAVAEPLVHGIVADDLESLRKAARNGMDEADILVFSAGSSVSIRDATSTVISDLGKPGILFHGVAVRPGKPTIGAIVGGKPVFGLPGNPVSAMNLFDLLIVPTIHWLLGCTHPPKRTFVRAKLARNMAATPGREDYVAAKLIERGGEWWAEPVFGKSNQIFTLVQADGVFVIPLDAAGIAAGEQVEVRLFRT